VNEYITIRSREDFKKLKGKTDWDRVRAMTDEEIEAAANSDPDAPLNSPERLKGFRPAEPDLKPWAYFLIKIIKNLNKYF